jgi:hypothetical protein
MKAQPEKTKHMMTDKIERPSMEMRNGRNMAFGEQLLI